MSFGHLLFDFSGRINRAKYWLAVVFWTLVFLLTCGIVLYLIGRGVSDFSAEDIGSVIASFGIGIVVVVLVMIPMVISGFAIGIKRLHDRDKSGWWILLFYFGPPVLDAIGRAVDVSVISFVLSLASFVIAIWGLVQLGFLRGTPGPNQYGPDPLAKAPA
jgi:uncharacterized membrane protein YhaH (DUF805 family)